MSHKKEVYIHRILESISLIKGYIQGMNFSEFEKDRKSRDACLMQLMHLSESLSKFHQHFPNEKIPIKYIKGTRNIIAHDYLAVDIEIIWNTLQEDLPILEKTIQDIEK